MENDEKSAGTGTVRALVGLDEWQAWIDARPGGDQRYLVLAIRVMIAADEMPVDQVREITTWSLAVERNKANKDICGEHSESVEWSG